MGHASEMLKAFVALSISARLLEQHEIFLSSSPMCCRPGLKVQDGTHRMHYKPSNDIHAQTECTPCCGQRYPNSENNRISAFSKADFTPPSMIASNLDLSIVNQKSAFQINTSAEITRDQQGLGWLTLELRHPRGLVQICTFTRRCKAVPEPNTNKTISTNVLGGRPYMFIFLARRTLEWIQSEISFRTQR